MTEWIYESLAGDWLCVCGNTPDAQGFWPYADGHQVDASDPRWDGHASACRRCRRIVGGWNAEERADGSIRLPVIDRPDTIVWLED